MIVFLFIVRQSDIHFISELKNKPKKKRKQRKRKKKTKQNKTQKQNRGNGHNKRPAFNLEFGFFVLITVLTPSKLSHATTHATTLKST